MTDSLASNTCLDHHLARIQEFETMLRDIMPESAHMAWATHLRMTAFPTISFLGQAWAKPVGLITELAAELGASVAWVTRQRAEPAVMTAAITPQGKSDNPLKVDVEDKILCAVCNNPLMIITASELTWIGPRRAVHRCHVFPVCATCRASDQEHPGFLYRALCDLTRPAVGIRGLIPGGGQGDGRPRGVLRVVRIEEKDGKG